MPPQIIGRPDSRKHQELGRLDGARRKNDLTTGANSGWRGGAGTLDFNARGALPFERELQHAAVGPDDEVRPAERGHQKRRGRRVPASVLDVLLIETRAAFLAR